MNAKFHWHYISVWSIVQTKEPVGNIHYCINTGAARYQLPCINGHKSRVFIREFS